MAKEVKKKAKKVKKDDKYKVIDDAQAEEMVKIAMKMATDKKESVAVTNQAVEIMTLEAGLRHAAARIKATENRIDRIVAALSKARPVKRDM